MSDQAHIQYFQEVAGEWLVEGAYIDARYVGVVTEGASDGALHNGWVRVSPSPVRGRLSFEHRIGALVIGQHRTYKAPIEKVHGLLADWIEGRLSCRRGVLRLSGTEPIRAYTELIARNYWSRFATLRLSASYRKPLTAVEAARVDERLRVVVPPFDGMAGATQWLGLPSTERSPTDVSLELQVVPPVALDLRRSQLEAGELRIGLVGHAKMDREKVVVACIAGPATTLEDRHVLSGRKFTWRVRGRDQHGECTLRPAKALNYQVLVQYGNFNVQRQWLMDPAKSQNFRYLALQGFDVGLVQLRRALLESKSSDEFEKGVCALFFALGFAPAPYLERDAPDLVIQAPSGRVAVVECTTKVSDFANKLGKLIDRRDSLTTPLKHNGYPQVPIAVLVCRVSRSVLRAHLDSLRSQRVVLAALENLEEGIEFLRQPNDPDALLDRAIASFGAVAE